MSTATAVIADQSDIRIRKTWAIRPSRPGSSASSGTNISPTSSIPGGRHLMHIEAFLRALMRDVGWGFFYGTVNFDNVLGTHQSLRHRRSVYRLAERGLSQQQPPLRRDIQCAGSEEGFRSDARRLDQRRLRPLCRARRNRRAFRPQARQQHQGAQARAHRRQTHGRSARRSGLPHRRRRSARQPAVPRCSTGLARGSCRARIRRRGSCVQHVRLYFALGRDVESVGRFEREGQPDLRHDRRAHAADLPRQRPRRVVHPDLRRNHLGH